MDDSNQASPERDDQRSTRQSGASLVVLEITTDDGRSTATIAGEIDRASAPGVKRELLAAITGRSLLLDLSQVTFIDSSGLAVLVMLHLAAQDASTSFRIAATNPLVDRILELSGLGHLRD